MKVGLAKFCTERRAPTDTTVRLCNQRALPQADRENLWLVRTTAGFSQLNMRGLAKVEAVFIFALAACKHRSSSEIDRVDGAKTALRRQIGRNDQYNLCQQPKSGYDLPKKRAQRSGARQRTTFSAVC